VLSETATGYLMIQLCHSVSAREEVRNRQHQLSIPAISRA